MAVILEIKMEKMQNIVTFLEKGYPYKRTYQFLDKSIN